MPGGHVPLVLAPERDGSGPSEEDEESDTEDSSLTSNRFTWCHTACFLACGAVPTSLLVLVWACLCIRLTKEYPDFAAACESDFTLKSMTFLVGILTSLTLSECLDRYRQCYLALLGFREELRSIWYYLQLRCMRAPGLKFLLDAHMVWYTLSLVRYLYEQQEKQNPGANPLPLMEELVQPDLRPLVLFLTHEDGGYPTRMSSDVNLAELRLVSWFQAMGVLDTDLSRRWRVTRRKVTALINAERVKTPRTSRHLQMVALHLFFLLIPVCADKTITKLMAPGIALILMSLLKLSMELEDPFGFDTHDLPWREVLASVSTCSTPALDAQELAEVIQWFNAGSMTGKFGPAPEAMGTKKGKVKLRLGEYLTLPAVLQIHAGRESVSGGEDFTMPDLYGGAAMEDDDDDSD